MSEIRKGLRCPVVFVITKVYCRWCQGIVRKYVSKIRRKKSSYDTNETQYESDYHEECWCEAIEVTI